MPNNTHGRNHTPLAVREVERLRTIVADFAERYFGVHQELQHAEASNTELRAQNKFLVNDNASLEQKNKKLEAQHKTLSHVHESLRGQLEQAGLLTVDEDGNPNLRHLNGVLVSPTASLIGRIDPPRQVGRAPAEFNPVASAGFSHVGGHQIASTDFVGLDLSEAAELAAQALTSGTKRSEPLPFRNLVTQPAPKEQP